LNLFSIWSWTQSLHLEPLHLPFFVKGFFKIGSRRTICPGWLWIAILQISASVLGLVVILICMSPWLMMASFHGFIDHLCSFFEEMPIKILFLVLNLGYLSFYCWLVRIFNISWTLILYQIYDLQISSSFCGLSFYFLDNAFWITKTYKVISYILYNFNCSGFRCHI
jgi:hypothetical protein